MNYGIFMNIFYQWVTILTQLSLIDHQFYWTVSLLFYLIFEPSNTLIRINFDDFWIHLMIPYIASNRFYLKEHVFFFWVLGDNKPKFFRIVIFQIMVSCKINQTFASNSKQLPIIEFRQTINRVYLIACCRGTCNI